MLHISTRTRLISIMIFLLLTCAPPSARARVGDRLEDAKRTDFFRFFNLVEAGATEAKQQRKVFVFRPRAGMFREAVNVTAIVDSAGRVLTMKLVLDRAFVDHKQNGIFARDIAKSFLRHAIPLADEREVNDLANEIEFPRMLEGYEIMRTGPDPQLPARPTQGYLVFLGERPLSEQRLKQSLVRLQNSNDGGDEVLTITVDGTVQPAKKTKRTKDERK
ncbi:MAG: hypothetical protein LC803_24250 [Acidobacteria bacterium]|nr:hypothetical protein [Acidobacteriota bacterium]